MERDKADPILKAARKRREQLHEALEEVEEALIRPGPGRMEEWTRALAESLGRLRDAFKDHVLLTERPGGLHDEIREQAVRLLPQVERLTGEHQALRDSIDGVLDRLAKSKGGVAKGEADWTLAGMRDEVEALLGSIQRHRQRGADVVWEAYNVDLGGLE